MLFFFLLQMFFINQLQGSFPIAEQGALNTTAFLKRTLPVHGALVPQNYARNPERGIFELEGNMVVLLLNARWQYLTE